MCENLQVTSFGNKKIVRMVLEHTSQPTIKKTLQVE